MTFPRRQIHVSTYAFGGVTLTNRIPGGDGLEQRQEAFAQLAERFRTPCERWVARFREEAHGFSRFRAALTDEESASRGLHGDRVSVRFPALERARESLTR